MCDHFRMHIGHAEVCVAGACSDSLFCRHLESRFSYSAALLVVSSACGNTPSVVLPALC